ncbi:MAG: hypothetical protein RR995_03350 [Hungatella sp.]
MKFKQIKVGIQTYKKQIFEILAVGAVVTGLAFFGQKPRTVLPIHEESSAIATANSEAEPTVNIPASTAELLPQLDPNQIELFDAMIACLQEENMQEAAKILHENEPTLQYLYGQVLEGKRYLYRDGVLSEELSGTGLVLKQPFSIFYGEFQDGYPQGEGTALQVIQLDALRYDYSVGSFEKGKMEGQGMVGYSYYEGIQGEENQSVQKEGTFVQDRMEGDLAYRTINSEGVTTIWDIKAENGKTKIDERWVHEEKKQDYYLPATQDNSRAYVLPESDLEEVRWRNMLLWEE